VRPAAVLLATALTAAAPSVRAAPPPAGPAAGAPRRSRPPRPADPPPRADPKARPAPAPPASDPDAELIEHLDEIERLELYLNLELFEPPEDPAPPGKRDGERAEKAPEARGKAE
jgi:hypothetical protein